MVLPSNATHFGISLLKSGDQKNNICSSKENVHDPKAYYSY